MLNLQLSGRQKSLLCELLRALIAALMGFLAGCAGTISVERNDGYTKVVIDGSITPPLPGRNSPAATQNN